MWREVECEGRVLESGGRESGSEVWWEGDWREVESGGRERVE